MVSYFNHLVGGEDVVRADDDIGAEAGQGDEDGNTAKDEVDEGGQGIFTFEKS